LLAHCAPDINEPLELAHEGARVIVAEISEDHGNAIAGELTALGFKAAYIHTDVSSFESVQAAVDFAVQQFGGLNVMFNNAGVGFSKALLDYAYREGGASVQPVTRRRWSARAATHRR